MSIKEIQNRHTEDEWIPTSEHERGTHLNVIYDDRGELLDAMKEQTAFIDVYLGQPDQTKVWNMIHGWDVALKEIGELINSHMVEGKLMVFHDGTTAVSTVRIQAILDKL